jgi:hypothetical protein
MGQPIKFDDYRSLTASKEDIGRANQNATSFES